MRQGDRLERDYRDKNGTRVGLELDYNWTRIGLELDWNGTRIGLELDYGTRIRTECDSNWQSAKTSLNGHSDFHVSPGLERGQNETRTGLELD